MKILIGMSWPIRPGFGLINLAPSSKGSGRMAKNKSGPGPGMTITLVIFILSTLILGALTYFGYADQENLTKTKNESEAKAKSESDLRTVADMKRIALSVAVGVASNDDRKLFQEAMQTNQTAQQEVQKLAGDLVSSVQRQLGDKSGSFTWPNLTADPSKTILAIVDDAVKSEATFRDQRDNAEKGRKRADDERIATVKSMESAKQAFDAAIAELRTKNEDLNKQVSAGLANYQSDVKKKGEEIETLRLGAQDKDDSQIKEINKLKKDREELDNKIKKLENVVATGPNLYEKDESKGRVDRRDETFIYLNLGSAQFLRPQTTFTVLPSSATWRNADERESFVKGTVEVVEIIGPYTSRAKITSERQPIRNPIRAGDVLFNLAWSPGQREHIAFAGIIDLNGDGIDDNNQFIRMMENQGVIVDEYIDLMERKPKGPGMKLTTKFLVVGPRPALKEDFGARAAEKDPRIAAKLEFIKLMGESEQKAKSLGVQLIDYRKFLTMIGQKLPERATPPDYGNAIYTRSGDEIKEPVVPKTDGQ
jgi:hypothetical protein